MKKVFFLSIVLGTLSLFATEPTTEQSVTAELTPQQIAAFWCAYCNAHKDPQQEIDLKAHLVYKHNRCGECGQECASLLDLRKHEATHVTHDNIKKQQD